MLSGIITESRESFKLLSAEASGSSSYFINIMGLDIETKPFPSKVYMLNRK